MVPGGLLRRYHSPCLALDERVYGRTPVPAPRMHRARTASDTPPITMHRVHTMHTASLDMDWTKQCHQSNPSSNKKKRLKI